MKKKSEIDENKVIIIHTMVDGTIRSSIEGYRIPYNEITAIAYELIVKNIMDNRQNQSMH